MAPLVLASGSPQRRAILEQAGIDFTVRVSGAEELEDGDPAAVAAENARRKARAVPAPAGAAVLGVDTVVALDGRIYGKPSDVGAARRTLEALSARTHTVLSGVCLLIGGEERVALARTAVSLRALDERLLNWYVTSGEWRERAGGYAIQGRGAALITRIDGDYLNVVGLPLATLLELHPDGVNGFL